MEKTFTNKAELSRVINLLKKQYQNTPVFDFEQRESIHQQLTRLEMVAYLEKEESLRLSDSFKTSEIL